MSLVPSDVCVYLFFPLDYRPFLYISTLSPITPPRQWTEPLPAGFVPLVRVSEQHTLRSVSVRKKQQMLGANRIQPTRQTRLIG